jgi:1-deoxy-D-xylulose-5-phosphate synthase
VLRERRHFDPRAESLDAVIRELGGLDTSTPIDDLELLAEDIRGFLIDAVTTSGGHLGSNLGIVELSIALHRHLQRQDAVLFDTGHQAYVHKILTGRARKFGRLRAEHGLSGYPDRREHESDWIENSHASVALGYAFGLRMADHPGRIAAVVGDGALTGGPALEALANIGHRQADVLCVLNDNGRSYAPTVSGYRAPGGDVRAFFESQGWRYVGPVDGHDFSALDAGFAALLQAPGPTALHALTEKGRGHPASEQDEARKGHDVRPAGSEPGTTFTEVFSDELHQIALGDPDIVAVTAAMPHSTGVHVLDALGPGRMVDVGIAEATAVTTAAGLALGGRRPIVALYSTFLPRAIDEVVYDVALHSLDVVFALDRSGITGPDGPSHHGLLDLGLLRAVPGMTVLTPASGAELRRMLRYSVRAGGPVAIRWSRGPVPDDPFPPGAGIAARKVVCTPGARVSILAVGPQVWPAVEAADLLASVGVGATVWDVRCAAPLDARMLMDALEHEVVVVTEDAYGNGGVGAAVAAWTASQPSPQPMVMSSCVPQRFVPAGHRTDLLRRFRLDGPGLAGVALSSLDGTGS